MGRRKQRCNAGKVLEDIAYKLLRSEQYAGQKFYFSVAENVLYEDKKGTQGEIDVFAVRHIRNNKRYIVLVECKLGDRRTKATKQLRRAKEHLQKQFPNVRIFCIYIHSYKRKTGRYKIKWLRRL